MSLACGGRGEAPRKGATAGGGYMSTHQEHAGATLSRLCLKAYEDGLDVAPGVAESMYVRPPSITTKKAP